MNHFIGRDETANYDKLNMEIINPYFLFLNANKF